MSSPSIVTGCANLFHTPPEIFLPDASRWAVRAEAAVGAVRKMGLISLSAN